MLVDHARRRAANKRGGEPLDHAVASFEQDHLDVLALDEALRALEAMNSRPCEIVTRRFFGGLSVQEIADQLQVSVGTVENDFRIARAWLRGKLREFAAYSGSDDVRNRESVSTIGP